MNISFMGAGLMGCPMIQQLTKAGHQVTVFTRRPEQVAELTQISHQVSLDAGEVLAASEYTVLMLSDADAIGELVLNESTRSSLRGRYVINMATISPSEAREIKREIESAGGNFIECPVLGSIPEASAGRLILMAGCSPEQFEIVKPILSCFGPKPRYIGEVGKASALKLAMNQLIASLTSAFALSLGLVREEGVGVDLFMDVLRDSALYAPTFDKKLQRMLGRDFDGPNFPVRHLLKDVRLFLESAREHSLDVRMLGAIGQVLEESVHDGLGDKDYSALYQVMHPVISS